jgi:hypothetical protein
LDRPSSLPGVSTTRERVSKKSFRNTHVEPYPESVGIPHRSCAALRLGWSLDDADRRARGGGAGRKSLRGAHGTSAFTAYAVQRRAAAVDGGGEGNAPLFGAGATGIYAQDTKGHQFYDRSERAFADRLLRGAVKEGSTAERASTAYWAALSRVGLGSLVRAAEAAHCPSVVVFVFDVSLRAFGHMIDGDDGGDGPRAAYQKIAASAKRAGLASLAVLTHVDVLAARAGAAATTSPTRVGEEVASEIDALTAGLSAAVGADLLPAASIFPLTNYHVDAPDPDASVDLAALEFLAAVVDAGEAFLARKRARADACALA